MTDERVILVCSCEDTIPLDPAALKHSCQRARLVTGRQFCRAELQRFRDIAGIGAPVTVGCTQELSAFRDAAGEREIALTFVNLREKAGWSAEAADAGPKMAALLAAAAVPAPSPSLVTFESEGVILIYGNGQAAVDAADLLKDHLDVTVLLTRPMDIAPRRTNEFPIVKGTVRTAKGHFGAFEITIDDYATPAPSSREALSFGPARDGAVSRCNIVLDLSGGAALFSAADLREGYVRADPGHPAAVLKAVLRARDLVGTFDKPRFIRFHEHLCAHSRSRIVGCHRCLDLCPAGAIEPAGNHVAIDAHLCAGCGQCASACPTGAATYELPPADVLARRLRTLLAVYREAGGRAPLVLFHDDDHGGALIEALARHGDGLPSRVLPFMVNEVTQVGLDAVVAAFAYGASAVYFLLRSKPRHDVTGLRNTIAFARPIVAGLGLDGVRIETIETDDPFVLGEALRGFVSSAAVMRPANFQPAGSSRDVLQLSLRELHRAAGAPVEIIPLPAGAPLGAIEVDTQGCTLCLACVSACPTGALSDDPERPLLRFAEAACVQCGLCKATCPEKVISLVPRIDFLAATAPARVLKEEEPFCCVRCGKPFGVKSMIERVVAQLEGKHWMYRNTGRLDAIRMCGDCRVVVMTEQGFDPYGQLARPDVRTTDDYLGERDKKPPT